MPGFARVWCVVGLTACAPAGGVSVDVEDAPVAADSARADADADAESGPLPNLLYVVLDDPGPDRFRFHDPPEQGLELPTLEALAADGVVFTEAWASPSCSPSRASAMTGRHPNRHGIGRWIYPGGNDVQLPLDEVTIPEVLAKAATPYTSVLVGKWHLVSWQNASFTMHPMHQGFSAHRGSLGNPLDWTGGDAPKPRTYQQWQKNTDGELSLSETYITTDSANEAISLLADLPEPWFVVLAFNAPHQPWERPPMPFEGHDLPDDASNADLFDAMLKAVDVELGRVIEAIGPETMARTTTLVTGDNGTSTGAMRPPYDLTRGKGTVWETGLDIPFFITGYGVAGGGRRVDMPVMLEDVLPTLAELAGLDATAHVPAGLDGISLVPWLTDGDTPHVDRALYAENFTPAGQPPHGWHIWAARNATHKLMKAKDGRVRLFDYRDMGLEEDDALDLMIAERDADDEVALAFLEGELERLQGAKPPLVVKRKRTP